MALTPQQENFYSAQTAATLFTNEQLKQQFMQAYGTSEEAIKTFLTEALGLPAEFAEQVITKRQQGELPGYIGTHICNYLW